MKSVCSQSNFLWKRVSQIMWYIAVILLAINVDIGLSADGRVSCPPRGHCWCPIGVEADDSRRTKGGSSQFFPQFEGEPPIPHDNNEGNVIQLSSNTVYIIGGIIAGLLLINLICLSYGVCSSSKQTKKKYIAIKQIVSSDDDMQNLKEYPV